MCGICGIVNLNSEEPVDRPVVIRMTNALSHRGPDDDGFFFDRNVGLGHRRLSIIDVAGGQQPIYNEDESAVIIFNGEVYNFADLRRDLLPRGHVFRTRSDTETILHGYEQYGDDCVERLRGMFAFAIWDLGKKRLLLARDRLGIKPMYYCWTGRCLAFASEIKSLLQVPQVPRAVDPEALDLYLSLRYVPGPRTFFSSIHKLQPGHVLILEKGEIRIRQYWDIQYEDGPAARPQEYAEQLEQLLNESVRLRLISEVPLGVFLSGGLDSSSILAVMTRIAGKGSERIKTFSVGYEAGNAEEEKANEFEYARQAAKAFNADHHEFELKAAEFGEFLPDLVWYLDEPMADPTCIPLFYISRVAREYVTVVLSGEGADEILAGYNIYNRMLALEQVHTVLGKLGSALLPALSQLVPGEAVRNYVHLAAQPLNQRYTGVSRAFREEVKQQLLGTNRGKNSDEKLAAVFSPYYEAVKGTSPLNRMLYVDAKTWLVDDLLLKADRMTMANGMELRVPFLDHHVVEFAARLPLEFKLAHGTGKQLLRKIMQPKLPASILQRTKKGFPVPTQSWLRGPLRGMVRDALLRSNSACRRFLSLPTIERLVRENESGAVDRHQEIWTLLVFEYWHSLFIESRSADPNRQFAANEFSRAV